MKDKTFKAYCEKCKCETKFGYFTSRDAEYNNCLVCYNLTPLPNRGFHTQDGLFFRREADGSVMIYKKYKNQWFQDETSFAQTLDAKTWESVVNFINDNSNMP